MKKKDLQYGRPSLCLHYCDISRLVWLYRSYYSLLTAKQQRMLDFSQNNFQSPKLSVSQHVFFSVFYHGSPKANIKFRPTWKWFLKGVQPTNLTNIWLNQRPLETAKAGKGTQLLKWQPIIKMPLARDTVIPQMFAVYEIWVWIRSLKQCQLVCIRKPPAFKSQN